MRACGGEGILVIAFKRTKQMHAANTAFTEETRRQLLPGRHHSVSFSIGLAVDSNAVNCFTR